MNEKTLDISWETIGRVSIAILVFYLLFLTRDIFMWMLFGVVISILFEPVIDFASRFGIPRGISVVSVYLAFCGILALTLYSISPFFVNEIQRFSQLLPQYLQVAAPPLKGFGQEAFSTIQGVLTALGDNAQKVASNVLAGLFAVLGGIFSAIFVLSIAIFLSLEEKSVERFISFLFPKVHEPMALSLWRRAQKKVTGWFISRLLSSAFVGLLMFVTLFLFDVKYLFSLSLLAGILNFIPVVGPLVTALFLGVVVAFDSFTKALLVLLAFTLIQQIENNVLTPILTKRFVGLHPVLVLLALTIGGKLWGVMGAVLAVPLVGILFEFLHDFLERRRKEEESS
ncbi:MAG: AI-2E family transporter [bacterium]|nr:AI-2E family transporter [bacterium]